MIRTPKFGTPNFRKLLLSPATRIYKVRSRAGAHEAIQRWAASVPSSGAWIHSRMKQPEMNYVCKATRTRTYCDTYIWLHMPITIYLFKG